MQLLRTEHALLTDNVLGGVENDAIEFHVVSIPVVLALFHDNAAIERPLVQGESTIADDVADSRPRCETIGHLAVLHERLRVNREAAVVIHELQEIRCWRV